MKIPYTKSSTPRKQINAIDDNVYDILDNLDKGKNTIALRHTYELLSNVLGLMDIMESHLGRKINGWRMIFTNQAKNFGVEPLYMLVSNYLCDSNLKREENK